MMSLAQPATMFTASPSSFFVLILQRVNLPLRRSASTMKLPHAGLQPLPRRLRTEVAASCHPPQHHIPPSATRMKAHGRRRCLIWIKGGVSALALAIGSGATVI